MIVGKWNKSVILTYVGLLFAIFGMYTSIILGNTQYTISCLIIAGMCDLFDGFIARKIKRNEEEKKFGIQLDSLVDVVSFVALPIVLFITTSINEWYFLPIIFIFGIAGIARLGYFNILVEKVEGPIEFYTGLPVTYTALVFPTVYAFSYIVSPEIFKIILLVSILSIAILNVVKIKIPKPKSKFSYIFFSALSVLTLIIYLGVLN